jgi:hypothetical protein
MPQNVWLSQTAGGGSETLGVDLTSLPKVVLKGQCVGLEPMFRFARNIYDSKIFSGDVSAEFDVAAQGGGGGGGGMGVTRGGAGAMLSSPAIGFTDLAEKGHPAGVFGDIGSIEMYFREQLPRTILYNFTLTFQLDQKFVNPTDLMQKFEKIFQGGETGGQPQPAPGTPPLPPGGPGGAGGSGPTRPGGPGGGGPE